PRAPSHRHRSDLRQCIRPLVESATPGHKWISARSRPYKVGGLVRTSSGIRFRKRGVDLFAISVFRQQTWREFICMAVGTILGVSYRKQTASFVRKGCAMRAAWGVLFLSLVVNTSNCSAQTVGASLQGTVYDPSGGFVPGAAIEIRNVEQGAVRALITDDKGRYREPLLPPGEYELRVKVAGFQPVVLKGIKLTIGQDAVLDVKLEITGGVERINVSADEAPPI